MPRGWIVLSDGAGPSGGGLSGATGLSQLYRASLTGVLTPTAGIEVSALRIQEIYPANKRFNDPALNSPKSDAVTLAYAALSRDGPNERFPASAVIGGGLFRRPTNDPAKTRLTGGLMAGLEGQLWRPGATDHLDFTGGGRVVVLPSASHHQLYIIALTLGLRFG